MDKTKIIGITLIATGIMLLAFSYRASGAPVDQISEAFTGRYTDRTMWYIILGIGSMIGGGLMTVLARRAP